MWPDRIVVAAPALDDDHFCNPIAAVKSVLHDPGRKMPGYGGTSRSPHQRGARHLPALRRGAENICSTLALLVLTLTGHGPGSRRWLRRRQSLPLFVQGKPARGG